MRRSANPANEGGPVVCNDQAGISRRDLLKGVAAALPALFFPAGSAAAGAGSSVATWLRKHGAELPELAAELAEMERNAIEQNFPAVRDRIRYISVIRWLPGIICCAGVSTDREAPAMFDAAKAVVGDVRVRVLAQGWSYDRRVWVFFALGAHVGAVKPLIRSIAPPEDAWRQFDTMHL